MVMVTSLCIHTPVDVSLDEKILPAATVAFFQYCPPTFRNGHVRHQINTCLFIKQKHNLL